MITFYFSKDISVTGDITLIAERDTSWSNKVVLTVKEGDTVIFKSGHPVNDMPEIIFQDLGAPLTLIGNELFFNTDNLYAKHHKGYFFTGRLCTVFYNYKPIAKVTVNRFVCNRLMVNFTTEVSRQIQLFTTILLLMRYCRLDAD